VSGLRRLLWLGPLTVISAVLAALLVRVIASVTIDVPPDFVPLQASALIVFTIVLVAAGVVVFAGVGRWTMRPIPIFRRIALVALVLSMVPDLLLLQMPGVTWTLVVVLMVMHVAAWWPTVTLLSRWSWIRTVEREHRHLG
jgi:hypothetical protein